MIIITLLFFFRIIILVVGMNRFHMNQLTGSERRQRITMANNAPRMQSE